MAYSVYGYIKYKDSGDNCTEADKAKVYPYFYKVDSDSSDPQWADPEYDADDNGYYSLSLEDDQFLGTDAAYKRGKDRIFLAVVWNSNDRDDEDRDGTTFTHATFFDHLTTSDDSNEVNLDIYPKRAPVMDSHTFPDTDLLTQHEYTMSEISHANYTWQDGDCYDNSTAQKYTYSLVEIFDGHQLIDTIYDWGDSTANEVANSTSDTHTYTKAGNYTQTITVREKWNTQTSISQDVTVKYNEPIVDFDWSPTETNDWQGPRIKGQEEITFHNKSSDLDNRTWDSDTWGDETYTYDWVIEDKNQDSSDNTDSYNNKDHDYEPTKKFQSAGTKKVTLTCHWNDGFDDYTKSVTKEIEIYPFDIVPDFTWDNTPRNRGEDITFDPSSTYGDTDNIKKYDWIIEDSYPAPDEDNGYYTFSQDDDSVFDEGSPDNTKEVDNTYNIDSTENPKVKFHSRGDKNVTVTITYDDGWKDVTKSLTKVITPVAYVVDPAFSATDWHPKGRDVEVTFHNETDYTRDDTDLGYNIDWYVNDYYSECNLDNPSPGDKTDNSDSQSNVSKDTDMKHKFQNTDDNDVILTIRYDDGYQQVTKSLTQTVTPIVYDPPLADFTWDPLHPVDRDTEVTFTNNTDDPDDRFRSYYWTIRDQYNKYNPDNSDYGNSTPDNTETDSSDDSDYQPTHKFQDNIDEDITMDYHYDDGFCDAVSSITKTIIFDEYVLSADYEPTTEPDINQGFYGKKEIEYENTTDDPNGRMLDVDWEVNDRDGLNDDEDHISDYNDKDPDENLKFTFQYPSRKPFSAVNGSTAQNINKDISMTVRYDNGWSDQTFTSITKKWEAAPYELQSDITYECNVDGYKH